MADVRQVRLPNGTVWDATNQALFDRLTSVEGGSAVGASPAEPVPGTEPDVDTDDEPAPAKARSRKAAPHA
jgi:hypothetical protein